MDRASATLTPPSEVKENPQADPRPRLKRVDQQPLTSEARKPRRFGITIQSVYYYPSADGTRCAVLLRTSFKLDDGEKLACAIVPLTARTVQRGAKDDQAQSSRSTTLTGENISISNHIPHTAEYVLLGKQSESKNIYMSPTIRADVLGTGAGITGIGVNKQRVDHKSFTISLVPTLDTHDGQPDYLQWKYEDRNGKGIFYPSSTDTIVIVECTDGPDMNWFPFELRLEWELKVEVHGQVDALKIIRYMVRLRKHDGWCFHIKGNYNPSVAQKAVLAALDTTGNIARIPPGIGLDAAVPASMRSTTPPPPPPLSLEAPM